MGKARELNLHGSSMSFSKDLTQRFRENKNEHYISNNW